METNIKKLSQDVIAISARVHHNAEGLVRTESRVLGVEKSVRTSTIAVEQRIAKLEQSIKAGKIGINIRAVAEKVSQEVSEILTTNIGTADINELKQELKVLKTDIRADQNLTEGLREIVIELKDKVLNISSSSQRMIPTRSNAYATSNAAGLAEIMNSARECSIIKNSIERTVGLIRQLIATDLSASNIEVSLIKKCKLEDAPVVQKAISATEASLVKYVKFPDMSLEFYNEVSNLLHNAGAWCLAVESMYSRMEVHAINNSKGDTGSVGIFRDNFEQIIYEFIDELETCFSGWGTNKQRGNRVHSHHLSGPLKTKLIGKSNDFVKMKEYLIAEYGRPDRIVNDMLAGLMRKKKPSPTNRKERLWYFSDIISAL